MNVTSALPPSAPKSGDAPSAETPAEGTTFADHLARQLPENPVPKGERTSPKARIDRGAEADATEDKAKAGKADADAADDTAAKTLDASATSAVAAPAASPAAPVVVAAHQPHVAKEAAEEPAPDAEPDSDAAIAASPDASAVTGAAHTKPATAASPVASAAIAAAVAAQASTTAPETGAAQSDDAKSAKANSATEVVASTPAAERARTTHGTPAQSADAATVDATASAPQSANATPAQPTHQPAGTQPSPPPAQQAAHQPAADASAAAQTARNDAPVAARPAHFASDVAVEVVRQAAAGRHEFTIRLDPPDLGRIDVSLEFHRGEVRAIFSTDNPATHDLLRRDADGFARVLADSGFRADGGALRFDLRDSSQQRGFASADGRDGFGQSAAANDATSVPQPVRRRGLLDLVA